MCYLELLTTPPPTKRWGPRPSLQLSAVNTLPFARKDPKYQRPKNINDRTKFSMFGQHSSASTGGLVIQLTVQIANILFAMVCHGATPTYDRCRRGVAIVLEHIILLQYITLFMYLSFMSHFCLNVQCIKVYDSRNWPMLHNIISRPNIDAFWTLTLIFGSSLANGRLLIKG